jgi:hypothetical protein
VKTKWLVPIAFSALVALAVLVGSAGASPRALFALLSSDLKLRPGVSQVGHPRVIPSGLYGAFDATYHPRTGKLSYDLRWKGLAGSGFRAVVRSRATGFTYAVLCSPCNSIVEADRSREGLPIHEVKGTVVISRDVAYLAVGTYTFVEVDTTAYPSGEIGAPIYGLFVYPGRPVTKGEPRCC